MMTIPLATVPDLSQVERVRPLLEGRACVVLGSAPLSTPTADVADDELIVAVNGGIGAAPREVDLFVVGSKHWDKPMQIEARPLHKQMLQQAAGHAVWHALLLRGPKEATEGHTLAVLQQLRCAVVEWSVLDKPTKLFMEQSLCGRVSDKEPCSSGILAVAIALSCGASVRMVGFSWKPGYHYLRRPNPPTWWRSHVEADRRALVALRARYGAALSGALVEAVAA